MTQFVQVQMYQELCINLYGTTSCENSVTHIPIETGAKMYVQCSLGAFEALLMHRCVLDMSRF